MIAFNRLDRSQLGEMWRAAGQAKVPALRDYLLDLLKGVASNGKMIVFAHHLAVSILLFISACAYVSTRTGTAHVIMA
jgi:hypothetical protein